MSTIVEYPVLTRFTVCHELTRREVDATERAGIPERVFAAMFLAAWATAERVPLWITRRTGELVPHGAGTASDGLRKALCDGSDAIVRAVGFGVPILWAKDGYAFLTWPACSAAS